MTDDVHTVRVRPATREKREQILKAAVEIFGNKGSTNGTLADVAEQVGITHAGVLHHFGSKQKLLLEVLAYRDQADVADLAEKHIPDGPELFLHLVRTAFANEKRPGIVQAYTVLSSESVTDDHPGRESFEDRYPTLRREVTATFGVMDGLQLQWLLHPGVVSLGAASEFAIRAIVNGVLHPGPALESYARP